MSAKETKITWLTRKQAAQHLRISVKTLDRREKRGMLERHYPQGLLRYSQQELDEEYPPTKPGRPRKGAWAP